MKLALAASFLVASASAFAPVQRPVSSTALFNGPVIGKGGMADTRDPEVLVHEDARKSISEAPSFEEYMKQRAGAAAPAPAPAAAAETQGETPGEADTATAVVRVAVARTRAIALVASAGGLAGARTRAAADALAALVPSNFFGDLMDHHGGSVLSVSGNSAGFQSV